MKGGKVFTEAVRSMVASLNRVCEREHLTRGGSGSGRAASGEPADHRRHPAPHRRSVYSNIRHHGNTSSSSIPLCLADVLPTVAAGDRLGLCAFGGGFTFGASILEAN